MSSLIDEDPGDGPSGNTPEFSVSELSGAVKRAIEGGFGHVRVRGEVGRVSRPRSGHVYLDLKDDRAVLAGVIWKGTAQGLATQPEEGMEVIATGRLTTFAGQSRYQIVIEALAPAGVGALMAMLDKRRKALAAEGLFDEGRKRRIPYLPRVVGVVTSPSGAVIRDILHRFSDRFPVHVLVWPVAVQGERCAPEVTAAIRGFSDLPEDGAVPRPDVVIVARGGGSVEDLWGFNEEAVVRAAADCTIPLISAVGHETDTTLIDHVADRRAPTPTAAAEMAVPVKGELTAALAELHARRLRALEAGLDRRRQRLSDLARALPRPRQILDERRQRLDNLVLQLPTPAALLQDRRHRLERLASALPRPLSLTDTAKTALERAAHGLAPALRQHIHKARLDVIERSAGLSPTPLRQKLAFLADRLAERTARLAPAAQRAGQTGADRLTALARTLQTLSYERTIARGYAVVRDADGNVVSSTGAVQAGAALDLHLSDGHLPVTAGHGAAPRPAGKKPRAKGPTDTSQGSLF
ncbi:MAG: exodeoxyribonuclease VII large subunit [Pseudomonadota bacterium]